VVADVGTPKILANTDTLGLVAAFPEQL